MRRASDVSGQKPVRTDSRPGHARARGAIPPTPAYSVVRASQPSCGCPHLEERPVRPKVGPRRRPERCPTIRSGVGRAATPGQSRLVWPTLDGWLGHARVDSPRACLQVRVTGKRQASRSFPPRGPLQIDDPPTRAGFITALDDAYLMPRDDGYAIFWRTSGRDLCTVETDVAERALRRRGAIVRLGTWSGTLRGRGDDWTLWWCARRAVGLHQRRDPRRGRAGAHRALAGRTGARAGPRPALGAATARCTERRPSAGATAATPRVAAAARRPARPVPHAVAPPPRRRI